MSDRPDWPAPSPVTPRPGASTPSDETAREMQALLERYAGRTPLTPRPDWIGQVHMRVAQEAARTPSSRFVLAVRALSPRQAGAAFRASLAAAFGRGSFPAAARAQAMALVLLVVLSVGAMGAGGAVVVSTVIQPPHRPEHTVPATGPSPTPSRPTRAPRSSAAPDTQRPSEPPIQSPAAPSDPGLVGPVPSSPAADVNDAGGAPGTHPTPQPHPTQKPHPTPRADKTPKPHPTPGHGRGPSKTPAAIGPLRWSGTAIAAVDPQVPRTG